MNYQLKKNERPSGTEPGKAFLFERKHCMKLEKKKKPLRNLEPALTLVSILAGTLQVIELIMKILKGM